MLRQRTQQGGRLVATALGVMLLAASCGGSDDDEPAETTPGTTAETTQNGAPEGEELTQRVAVVPKEAGEDLEYAEEVTAKRGDKVSLQTTVGKGAGDGPLTVTIARRPGREVEVTARSGSETSVARIKASSAVKLIAPHFNCNVGERSVCPARGTKESARAFTFRGKAKRVEENGPLLIGAEVAGAKQKTPSTAKPYDARDGKPSNVYLRVAGPPAKAGEKLEYTDSLKAKTGQKLIVQTRALAGDGGKRLVVSIEKGPAKALKVTAKLGSRTASAEIKSSKPIRLFAARFDCTIERRSLCPPTKTSETQKAFEYVTTMTRAARNGPINISVNTAD